MGAVHDLVWEARHQLPWMSVNFLLAVLPALGVFALHHWWRRLWGIRWVILVMSALLLPNAPYVVTDLIHLPGWIHWAPSQWAVWLVVIPLFGVLIGSGVLSYAYTMHVMRRHMRWAGWSRRRRITVEVTVDLLCAVGVALGRISRLNSWDVVRPDRLAQGWHDIAADPRSVLLAFIIVVLADVAVDWVASGAAHRIQHRIR